MRGAGAWPSFVRNYPTTMSIQLLGTKIRDVHRSLNFPHYRRGYRLRLHIMGDISGSDASNTKSSGLQHLEVPKASSNARKKRNAFTEIMTPKLKQQKLPDSNPSPRFAPIFKPRDALGAYIASPETYPASTVLYYNDDFVVINDLYPKSSVHVLLLPRDPSKYFLHPFDAFDDQLFLQKVKIEVGKIRKMVAGELRRKYGRQSAQDLVRLKAMEQDPPPEPVDLPAGRNWEQEVVSGIHAHPSMNHLHIHVLSVDRYSRCMKHRKHYNSFATPFLIGVEDFPLAENDVRRHPGRESYLKRDLVCWRCGRNFRSKFTNLKDHLETEFREWKSL